MKPLIVGWTLFPRWPYLPSFCPNVCRLFHGLCVLLTSRYPKRFRKALSQAWLHEQVAPFQYFGILAPHWTVLFVYSVNTTHLFIAVRIYTRYWYQKGFAVSWTSFFSKLYIYSGCYVSWSVDVAQLPCKFEVFLGVSHPPCALDRGK